MTLKQEPFVMQNAHEMGRIEFPRMDSSVGYEVQFAERDVLKFRISTILLSFLNTVLSEMVTPP